MRPRKLGRATYPHDSWFWSVLEEYRDSEGRTLEEAARVWIQSSDLFTSERERAEALATRRWVWAPRSEKGVEHIIHLLHSFFHPESMFTYLEFGTCFGTTLARILAVFKHAHAIGVEVDQARFEVTRWLINRMDAQWDLCSRVTLHRASILDVPLPSASVDVVFMDTNHRYPDDFEFIMYLTTRGVLRTGFVFIGDDPLHTGTHLARQRFIAEQSARYKIATSHAKNLWWFIER